MGKITVKIAGRCTELEVTGVPLEAYFLGGLLRTKWDKDKRGPPRSVPVLAMIVDRTKPRGQQISYIDGPALIKAAGYELKRSRK